MRDYMRNKYKQRREDAISSLGGKCEHCGATENLEFDHINAKEKSFSLFKSPNMSKEKFEIELAKCQLLCGDCHKVKSSKNGDNSTKYENYICICGKHFNSNKAFAGHKRWCKG